MVGIDQEMTRFSPIGEARTVTGAPETDLPRITAWLAFASPRDTEVTVTTLIS